MSKKEMEAEGKKEYIVNLRRDDDVVELVKPITGFHVARRAEVLTSRDWEDCVDIRIVPIEGIGKFKNLLEVQLKNKTINIESNNVALLYGLGNMYAWKGSYETAKCAYLKALEFEPNNANYHVALGHVYVKTDQFLYAFMEFKKALYFEPDNANCHNGLGYFLLKDNKYRDAIIEHKKAIDLSKGNEVEYFYDLAYVYLKAKQYKQAFDTYKEAAKYHLYGDGGYGPQHLHISIKAIKSVYDCLDNVNKVKMAKEFTIPFSMFMIEEAKKNNDLAKKELAERHLKFSSDRDAALEELLPHCIKMADYYIEKSVKDIIELARYHFGDAKVICVNYGNPPDPASKKQMLNEALDSFVKCGYFRKALAIHEYNVYSPEEKALTYYEMGNHTMGTMCNRAMAAANKINNCDTVSRQDSEEALDLYKKAIKLNPNVLDFYVQAKIVYKLLIQRKEVLKQYDKEIHKFCIDFRNVLDDKTGLVANLECLVESYNKEISKFTVDLQKELSNSGLVNDVAYLVECYLVGEDSVVLEPGI